MARWQFTLERIRKLQPQAKIYAKWDSVVSGFGVRVYPGGKRSYVLRLRFNDDTGRRRERLHTVGLVSDFERVEDARRAALELRRRYQTGEDVKRTTQRKRIEGKTLGEWMDEWLAERLASGKHKPSTAQDVRVAAKAGWDGWMDRPLQKITPESLLRRHSERSATSKTRANLEARYLRALWRWVDARHPELAMGPPPTAALSTTANWNPRTRKTRRIDMADLRGWLEAVHSLANTRAAYLFELLLYTGLRCGEARELQWQHIDFKRGTLHLPNPKNKRATTLPMSSQALDVLHRCQTETGASIWVFPAMSKTGHEVHMTNPSKAIRRVIQTCSVQWSPHDLRRGFLSIGGALRLHPVLLQYLTNHAPAKADAHSGYFIPEVAELRAAAQAIGDRVEAAITGAKIIQLPNRSKRNAIV
jgi:integrase